METAYFKRKQSEEIFNYYKVVGGRGKTKHGYQEVINFLNDKPIIYIEHNMPYDPKAPDKPFELTGTWDTYEVGIPISKEDYDNAYRLATCKDFNIF